MTAITPVKMPKWGLSMIEGKVTGWLKREGDAVREGEELFEVETSKITNVGEAATGGVLRRIVAQVDDTLPVGALLGVMADASVSEADIDAFIAAFNANFVVEDGEGGQGGLANRVVSVEGLSINVVLAGEGATGDPVFFVHGFGGDAENWSLAMAGLATDRPVYAVELPGHGKSEKRVPEAAPSALADIVIGAMDALSLERAHLVGHSMGGAVALAAALAAPERVASLTLVCALGVPGSRVNADYLDAFIGANRARDMQKAAAWLFADETLATKELAENLVRAKRIDGVEEALGLLRDMMVKTSAIADLEARFGEAKPPLLVVWGALDRVVSAPDESRLPAQAQRVRIDGAGHMPQIERADAFIGALRAFLS